MSPRMMSILDSGVAIMARADRFATTRPIAACSESDRANDRGAPAKIRCDHVSNDIRPNVAGGESALWRRLVSSLPNERRERGGRRSLHFDARPTLPIAHRSADC